MTWTTTGNLGTFLRHAHTFLHSRPVEHTVPLTLCDTLAAAGPDVFGGLPPRFGWWRDGGGRAGAAFVHTPPRALQATPLPRAAVAPLAAVLGGPDGAAAPDVVEVPREVAGDFADAWLRLPGHAAGTASTVRLSRLHRLTALVPPVPPPPGRARAGTAADRDLLVRWMAGYAHALGEPELLRGAASMADDRLASGSVLMWEDASGVPVATAGTTRPVGGVVRINQVWTPPEHRRRGYAAGLTAAAAARALGGGAREVVLFTDLANPTSNALYHRLGFRPVLDRAAVRLRPA
ncbi:GNAT family N-acetyltransferase [Streptomyces sp. NPDC049881]|uniref:GNAT family N-acetyltransferase n=1 Tax=Streptomyces sp. NPDC049881 TaxID=3155778 RepID=UPI00342F9263